MSLMALHQVLRSMEQSNVIRRADSMKVFADGDPTFKMGQWMAWEQACQAAGKTLPPKDFKNDSVAPRNPFKAEQ